MRQPYAATPSATRQRLAKKVAALITPELVRTRSTCRLCRAEALKQLWSFGVTPLANNFLTSQALAQGTREPHVPLEVYRCARCHLVQLKHVVDPTVLFDHYLYVSSTSPVFVQHFADYAQTLVTRFGLKRDALVVDVGSNDGVLLKPLQQAGMRVVGIDPAKNIAAAATAVGIPTLPEFFTPAVAQRVRAEHGSAAIVTANNVFAHTDAVDDFVAAVQTLLAPAGVFVFEVQYVGDLIANNLFDTVYHEHLNYYHLTPLLAYLASRHLTVFDVERVPVHGGSLRVYAAPDGSPGARRVDRRVSNMLREEQAMGLNDKALYQTFTKRVSRVRKELGLIVDSIKRLGRRVAGFGAPAKATTLCYAFGLNQNHLDFIVDDAPLKQGRLMPGTHIPIVAPERLYTDKPEYCLILAWNFAEPIMRAHERYADGGGRFIIPVPWPRIV